MKDKTYIWTLTLFVVFINVGIILFCTMTAKHNLSGIEESGLREHYFLVNNLTKDIRVIQIGNYMMDEAIRHACDSYKEKYASQNIYLQVYKDKKSIYSSLPNELKFHARITENKENMTNLHILMQGRVKYVQIEGQLLDEYSQYTLVYYMDITKEVNEWRKVCRSLFVVSFLFTVILSLCLFALLQYIFRPLEEISCVSDKIANGEYKEKLDLKGGKEITEVVRSFNTMSDKIRKQMETLEDHAKEKQRLIDDMAHELGTPLTAIYGYTQYMLSTKLKEEETYRSLQYILAESKRLKNISENLLEMATIREDEVIEMVPINIGQLFKRVHQTESIKLKEKEIAFFNNYQISEIYGNEDLIESMLINLVDNAIKACKLPNSKITLSAYEKENSKIIEVTDNGKGMTKEQMSHITEAFFRVDKARSRKEGGNGLGLALCEEIAKKHHAKLLFNSEIDRGTTVRVMFETV